MKLLKGSYLYTRISFLLIIGFWNLLFSADVQAQVEKQLSSSALTSEAPSLRFERLGVEDGMLQGSANNIMQDSNGYLWISTQGGLHRYDGYEFKAYTSVPFDSTSLSQTWVWTTTEASNGDILVSTNNGGLNRLNPATGKSIKYLHDPEDSTSLSSNLTFFSLESSKGDLWVSTFEDGLNRMRVGTDVFEHYRHDPDDPSTITSDQVFWITEDEQNHIWVSSTNGLNRINPETDQVTRYLHDGNQRPNFGANLNTFSQYHPEDNSGVTWVATGRGLVRLNVETGEYDRYLVEDTGDQFDPKNLFFEVRPDPFDDNILWAGGPGAGVARFDKRTGQYTSYKNNPKDGNSLSDNRITAMFADRSGTMWAGSGSSGLNAYNPKAVNFSHILHDPDDPKSLSPGVIWAIVEDSRGTFWVGTDTGGENFLTQFDAESGEVIKHSFDPNDDETLPPARMVDLLEDGDRMWVATSTDLVELDRKTGKIEPHFREDRRPRYVRYIEWNKLDTQTFWMAYSEEGLDLFDTRTNTFTDVTLVADSTQAEPYALCTYQDDQGVLWVGAVEGLYKVEPDLTPSMVVDYQVDDTTSLSVETIYFILERKIEPGILWLATAGGGLNRFDVETGIATHITADEGLADNTIYTLAEDANGTLWMSTNIGISNYNPETGKIRNYGLEDGLVALEYNARSVEIGRDGTIYFGNGKGITAFSPERLSTNPIPPQVVLSDIKLFNKSIASDFDTALVLPSAKTQNLTVEYAQNEITFEFVAIHFTNPKKNKYRYQLVGFDEEWVVGNQTRSATYTNLSPGDYVFRVIAANSDGVWNEEGVSLNLTVLPPWYQTWWAYLLFAFIFALGVFAVDRIQRYRLRKIEKERAVLREAELRAEAENKRRADTEELSKIGRTITSSLSVNKIIETVYENVNALMDASVFGVGIYNKEENRLDFPATKEEGEMLPPYSYPLDEGNEWLSVWCFKKEQEIVISDFDNQYNQYLSKYTPPIVGKSPASIIYIPLIQQGRTIGVITTQSFEKNAYSEYHVNLFRNLANYAAIALDNASAYRKLDATVTELQATQEQLVHSEKMASLGELTAGIAHEIQNPLNFVNNFSEVNSELIDELLEEVNKGNIKEIAELANDLKTNEHRIAEHGERASSIVKGMLQHSRSGSGEKEKTDVNAMADEYLRLAYHGLRAKDKSFNAEFKLELDDKLPLVNVIPQDIGRVLLNLINNAFHAVSSKALATKDPDYLPLVTVKTEHLSKNDAVCLTVADNGSGVPEDIKDKIFQPFFTTKSAGEGTGLGLSLSFDIITKGHNGELYVDSDKLTGSRFIITLPV